MTETRLWIIVAIALTIGVLLTTCAPASAQTVYNPRIIQFDSPDHATLVTGYTVEFWIQGVDPTTGAPVASYALTKDKVVASGLMAPDPQYQANLADMTPVPAIPIGNFYVARMVAVGQTPNLVSPRSLPSNPFASAGAPASAANLRLK